MADSSKTPYLGIYSNNYENIDKISETAFGLLHCNFFAFQTLNPVDKARPLYSVKNSDIFCWNQAAVAVIRDTDVKALTESISWAMHLSVDKILFECCLSDYGDPKLALKMAKSINNSLVCVVDFYGEFWVRVPCTKKGLVFWKTLRKLSCHKKQIFPVIELSSEESDEEQIPLEDWYGRNLRCVILSTNSFLSNEEGLPVLQNDFKSTLVNILKRDIRVLLIEPGATDDFARFVHYFDYVKSLQNKYCFLREPDRQSKPYRDYIQLQIQPQNDNLSSGAYENFEKDTPKYLSYREAILGALADMRHLPIVRILIVGPGRGPLVDISISAAESLRMDVDIVAVERNPFAILLLNELKKSKKWENVRLIGGDVRDEKLLTGEGYECDLIVSELLGSFGDNELSPEILCAAERFLKPGGVVIPQKYVSFVAPVFSETVWEKIDSAERSKRDYSVLARLPASSVSRFEVGYVVNLFDFRLLGEVTECWEFSHSMGENVGLLKTDIFARSAEIKFEITQNEPTEIHAFAGFFKATLYKDVVIGITPDLGEKKMISWFPYILPLKDPIEVKKGENVVLSLERKSRDHKVWYEWCVTEPKITEIHNAGGRSFMIG